MSERFSIKGKGAELFFGSEERGDSIRRADEAPVVDERASQRADIPADMPAGEPASMQASKPASTQHEDTSAAPLHPSDEASLHERLRDLISRDHPVHNSYRFTAHELDALRDVVYELEAKRGLQITRNDVVRLGLNWVIDDYHAHGKDSVLMRVMKEERWKP